MWAMLIYLIAAGFNIAAGSKILLQPVPAKSHVLYFALVGNELVRQGHEVHILLSNSIPALQRNLDPAIVIHFYTALTEEPGEDDETANEVMKNFLHYCLQFGLRPITLFRMMSFFAVAPFCDSVLSDKPLNDRFSALSFDFAIVDGFPATRCMYILPYRLGIPYASITTQYEPWLYGIPALPSVVPFALQVPYTEQMSFTERVWNFLQYLEWHIIPLIYTWSGFYTTQYAPEKPYKPPNQLAAESKLWLLNTDVAIDYARPLLPHVVEVGGLTTNEPKPLPEELQKFMDEAEDGVILVSFGSLAPQLPAYIDEAVSDVIKTVHQRVIWKCKHCNASEDPNVRILPWVPQNSILSHPNLKLFITHGGNNGQFEALYNAVPMVVVPLFADQFYNANRIQYKRYGVAMETHKLTSNDLLAAIDEVLGDPTYKSNITLGSKIFKSHPMSPKERATYWIEHVIKYGDAHLLSHAVNMSWYQYWMLDILFVLSVPCIITGLIVLCIIKKCSGTGKTVKRS